MNNNEKLNAKKAETLLRRIFIGGVISTFEYWSEFNLRVETDARLRQGSPIPPAFHLRLRANWWIGQKTYWDQRVAQFPIRARRTQSADPLRASLIIEQLGMFDYKSQNR